MASGGLLSPVLLGRLTRRLRALFFTFRPSEHKVAESASGLLGAACVKCVRGWKFLFLASD